MALVHNLLTRYLNSIYLQAPHIIPDDVPNFCRYVLCWHTIITIHHDGEEAVLFPWVDEVVGVKGIMEGNLEQHRAFHAGVENLRDYVQDVLDGKKRYDGGRVMALIDAFSEPLGVHLREEIPSLLGLRELGGLEKFGGLGEVLDKMAKHGVVSLGAFLTGSWSVVNYCGVYILTKMTGQTRDQERGAHARQCRHHIRGRPVGLVPADTSGGKVPGHDNLLVVVLGDDQVWQRGQTWEAKAAVCGSRLTLGVGDWRPSGYGMFVRFTWRGSLAFRTGRYCE